MKVTVKGLCILLSVLVFLMGIAPWAVVGADAQEPLKTHIPQRLGRELQTVQFDFSEENRSAYTRNDNLALGNATSIKISDGVLRCGTRELSFGSDVFVGDDYGLSQGYASFDMQVVSGEIALGVRLSKSGVMKEGRGIWFSFDGSQNITITEAESGLSVVVDAGVATSQQVQVRFEERLTEMRLLINGTVVCSLDYATDGYLAVRTANGDVLASTNACQLDCAGYVTAYFAGNTDGYIDNFSFTNYKIDQTVADGETRKIDYSTWTATDDLGRTTATNAEAGDTREKYVGVFYFLCWVGAAGTVQDNTKIYLEEGVDGLKSYLEEKGGEAYWSEPYFGYYRNTDTWVYRKHAYMLEAAGVDFIFLDVSNGNTFDTGHLALFDTWLSIRREGGMTPQIVFFCGDNPDYFDKDISHIRRTVYSEENYEKYKELFFLWEGKPLIFGNTSGISEESKEFLKDFTVRGNWAWCNQDGYWSWLQEYGYNAATHTYTFTAGGMGRDANGNFEQLAISLGHHPSMSKGRSYNLGIQPSTGKNDFGFTLGTSGEGICFQTQFEAAMSFDPTVLLITGWNEWIAGCVHDGTTTRFADTRVNGYSYIDQFNTEFSRDAEPMRLRDGVGFGDNYYYQMVDYIRKFKGMDKTTEATGQKTIQLDDISHWDNVFPEYMDNVGDTELRNTMSYDSNYRYVNNTGRNDIASAKVSQDADYLYFMVKCTADIQVAEGNNWMNLFLNTDGDASTGWEGYDYVINRSHNDKTVSVEQFTDGFASEKLGDAQYYLEGECLVVQIKKSMIGVNGALENFLFKWADNSTTSGNVMEFMDLGDAAPNDRYAFSYVVADGENIEQSENLVGFIAIVCAVSILVIGAAVIVIVKVKRQ